MVLKREEWVFHMSSSSFIEEPTLGLKKFVGRGPDRIPIVPQRRSSGVEEELTPVTLFFGYWSSQDQTTTGSRS